MATPARMIELVCPQCGAVHWEIDNDYRGMGGDFIPYSDRTYTCPSCARVGTGYETQRMSPPEFFLQPHPMYKMSRRDYDAWWNLLVENFPDEALRRKQALPKPLADAIEDAVSRALRRDLGRRG